MRRDLPTLSDTVFDVLVIGGGITGACAACDAAERGLSVALVDKGDFGGATSANSLKVLHGGLRYLQHLDFRRMRESIRERRAMAARMPHLVRPMPFLIPTYGRLQHSRAALRIALAMNDLVALDRNRDLPVALHLPRGRTVSRREYRECLPCDSQDEITGGAIWYDYQAIETERITLDFVSTAAELGAAVANYVSVEEPLLDGSQVCGVRARDVLGKDRFDIHSRTVVNATGPWIRDLAGMSSSDGQPTLALAINLVSRSPQVPMGIGVRSAWGEDRDPVCGGHRFMFMVPWKNSTLLGTSYRIHQDSMSPAAVHEQALQSVVDEFNESWPGLGLSLDDVTSYHWGFVPLKSAHEGGRPDALAERSLLIDHAVEEGRAGMISLSTVKYTTARRLAQRGIDLVCSRLGIQIPSRNSRHDFSTDNLASEEVGIAARQMGDCGDLPSELRKRLMDVYGKAWTEVVGSSDGKHMLREPLAPDVPVLGCEVQHAVTNEMALTLSDVVLRRTGLGSESCPPARALASAASIMGDLLSWTPQRRSEEVHAVTSSYAPLPFASSSVALSGAAGAWNEPEE